MYQNSIKPVGRYVACYGFNHLINYLAMNKHTESFIKSISENIGFVPTPEQRDKWLSELEKQWNCKLTSASELVFDYEMTPERQIEIDRGLVMKMNKSKSGHISAIFFGEDEDEKRWNMLTAFLDKIYKYAKIVDNKAVAIFYP